MTSVKLWYRRTTAVIALCAVGLAVARIARLYFQYVSQQIYEQCADHLVEVYSQVNHNFVSSGGRSLTPEGAVEQFELERAGDMLFREQERAMFMETLSARQAVTLFAIPVETGTYRGFGCEAIAVSYSNADIVASLDVKAFSNQSMCLIVNADGSVLLSTQPSAFGNYLSYLDAESNLGSESLAEIRRDWENSVSGVVRCEIGGLCQHLLSLINDVLDMSRIESGKTSLNIAVFYLPELMEELYTIFLPQARAKGLNAEILLSRLRKEQGDARKGNKGRTGI